MEWNCAAYCSGGSPTPGPRCTLDSICIHLNTLNAGFSFRFRSGFDFVFIAFPFSLQNRCCFLVYRRSRFWFFRVEQQQQTTNNKQTTKRLERAHFRDFRRHWDMWGHTFRHWLRRYLAQARKKLKKIRKIPKAFERFRTLPNVSERVRMHPSTSEQVPARLRTSENFENFSKFVKNREIS